MMYDFHANSEALAPEEKPNLTKICSEAPQTLCTKSHSSWFKGYLLSAEKYARVMTAWSSSRILRC